MLWGARLRRSRCPWTERRRRLLRCPRRRRARLVNSLRTRNRLHGPRTRVASSKLAVEVQPDADDAALPSPPLSIPSTADTTPTLKDPLSPVAKSSKADFGMASEMDVGLKGKSVMRSEPPEVASWANEEFDPVSLAAEERPYEVAYPPSPVRSRPRRDSLIADEMVVPRDIGALTYQ